MTSAQLVLSIQSQIISCTNQSADDIFCKYVFKQGPEWSIISGTEEGITQVSRASEEKESVWNHPVDIVFQSPKPFGWPQIIFSVFGRNQFGNETVVGYGAVHVPTMAGHHICNVAVYSRAPSSFIERLTSWFTGKMPESIADNFIAGGESRDIIKTESQGHIKISFDVVISGLKKLDLKVEPDIVT